jgi:hypothetical protein
MDKECTCCHILKPNEEFYTNPSNRNGFSDWCKECYRVERNRKIYRDKPLCPKCGSGYGLTTRGDCRKCLSKEGLRECRKCLELLPWPLLFYDGHATCKNCRTIQTNEYRKDNKSNYSGYVKKWRRKNPDRVRNQHLKREFGITLDQYNELSRIQNNLCAICQRSFNKKLHVDHDHRTNQIRGLLCGNCNRGLGLFEDNSQFLKSATNYIEQFKKASP